MSECKDELYASYVKKAWIIYTLVAITIAVILVLFVAVDNEERLFYALAPTVGAYAFRPLNKPFSNLIYKYTGVSHPSEQK
ncbi:MAG TPA: hypothetical protein QF499_07705 [Gammaproteobacteria bacterium]|jgi:hypothetical protein|nr:hypothetical protein [Chromatiales bacterium]HJP39004.1 hypothetical protein [Gammaproteobacteria bacterium]